MLLAIDGWGGFVLLALGAPMGALVISLDFELHWGIRDHTPLALCRDRLLGARAAIPLILEEFQNAGVHATWATVGMLFARTKDELKEHAPRVTPNYQRPELSAYAALSELGANEAEDPFHFAPSLIEQILATPGQELASHTYSHFYCLEPGQGLADFEADLDSAQRIAQKNFGVPLRSMVVPRNQENPLYQQALAARGFKTYRTNPRDWFYEPRATETKSRRVARLADAYLPLSSQTARATRDGNGLTALPATTFLRPYSQRLRHLEGLRLARIKHAMRRAAENDELFHLWWHPHNFGMNTTENLDTLRVLLAEFNVLRRRHRFESKTMLEVAEELS